MAERRFRLDSLVDVRGHGPIYRATQFDELSAEQPVLLQLYELGSQETDTFVLGLVDAALKTRMARHRAINVIDGLTAVDGRLAVVAAPIPGVGLQNLPEGELLPPASVCTIIGQLASALHTAHQGVAPNGDRLQMVHGNVGLSTVHIDESATVVLYGFVMGQKRQANQIATPQDDILALGRVFFRLLTGKDCEVSETTDEEDQDTKLRLNLVRLRKVLGDDGTPVVRLVGWMLATDPDDRPEAAELRRACSQARGEIGGEELTTWAPANVPRLREIADGIEDPENRLGTTLSEDAFKGNRFTSLLATRSAKLVSTIETSPAYDPMSEDQESTIHIESPVFRSTNTKKQRPTPAASTPTVVSPTPAPASTAEPVEAIPELNPSAIEALPSKNNMALMIGAGIVVCLLVGTTVGVAVTWMLLK